MRLLAESSVKVISLLLISSPPPPPNLEIQFFLRPIFPTDQELVLNTSAISLPPSTLHYLQILHFIHGKWCPRRLSIGQSQIVGRIKFSIIDDKTRALLTSLSIQPFPFPLFLLQNSVTLLFRLTKRRVDLTYPSFQTLNLETKTKLILQEQQMDLEISHWYLRTGNFCFRFLKNKLNKLSIKEGRNCYSLADFLTKHSSTCIHFHSETRLDFKMLLS